MLKITDVKSRPVVEMEMTGTIDIDGKQREICLYISDDVINSILLISKSGDGGNGYDCSIYLHNFKDLSDPNLEILIRKIVE